MFSLQCKLWFWRLVTNHSVSSLVIRVKNTCQNYSALSREQWLLLTSNRLAVSSSSSCSSWFLTCDRRSHSLSFSFSSWDVKEKQSQPHLTRKASCIVNVFSGHATLCVCQHKVGYNTFFAASSCSLRISDPFSLISSEELRSRERSPWSLPEVGTASPPPSTLDSGSGSRSTNLHTSRSIISPVSEGT